MRSCGVETTIVAGETEPQPDPVLDRTLAQARIWAKAVPAGTSVAEVPDLPASTSFLLTLPGRALKQLVTSLLDLVRVNVKILCQLDQRLPALDHGRRHFRLECRAVVPARSSSYELLFARSIMPPLRGKSTYPGRSDFRNHLCASENEQKMEVSCRRQEVFFVSKRSVLRVLIVCF